MMSKHSPFLAQVQQQGFTLVEVMIVIVVIGILAAIAVPAYTDYMRKSKVTEAMGLLSGLKTPTEEYFTSQGKFPDDVTLLTTKTSGRYTTDLKIDGSIDDTNGTMIYSVGFRDDAELAPFRLALARDSHGHWSCRASDTQSKTNLPHKYLPSTCK